MTQPIKPQIIGENFFLKTDGTLGGGETCCQCKTPCDCGSCAQTILVNGVAIGTIQYWGDDIANGIPAQQLHDCDVPCELTCDDLSNAFPYSVSYCSGNAGDDNFCDEFPPAPGFEGCETAGYVGCFGTALVGCVYCGSQGMCVRIYFYITHNYSCACNSIYPQKSDRAWHADYVLPTLPPCDETATMEQVADNDYPLIYACFSGEQTRASGCGECETPVVEVVCNPFP